jgi:type II secretion system protein G
MRGKRKQLGFTLIEMMVVLAVIGLLASVILASLNVARQKARDAKRKEDSAEVRKAIDLYYQEYGIYPPTAGSVPAGFNDWLFTQSIAPYLNRVPRDPRCASGSTCNYQYIYDSGQTAYGIYSFRTTNSM